MAIPAAAPESPPIVNPEWQKTFRRRVRLARVCAAGSILGATVLVFAAYPFREHATFGITYNFALTILMLSIPLACMFISVVGCPNPQCNRPIAQVPEVHLPPGHTVAPKTVREMHAEARAQAIDSIDTSFQVVLTNVGYTCAKCQTVLRDGKPKRWNFLYWVLTYLAIVLALIKLSRHWTWPEGW